MLGHFCDAGSFLPYWVIHSDSVAVKLLQFGDIVMPPIARTRMLETVTGLYSPLFGKRPILQISASRQQVTAVPM